jgi:hypothetical protein
MKILAADGVVFLRGGALVDAADPCGCCGGVIAYRCDGAWPPRRLDGPALGAVLLDADGHCYRVSADTDAFGLLEPAEPLGWYDPCWDCLGCAPPGPCVPWTLWGRFTAALAPDGLETAPAGDCLRHESGRPCAETWIRVGRFTRRAVGDCLCGWTINAAEITRVVNGNGTTRIRAAWRGSGGDGCDALDEEIDRTVAAAATAAPTLALVVGESQSVIEPRWADGWTGSGFIGCRVSTFSASINRSIDGGAGCEVVESGAYTEVHITDSGCDGLETDPAAPNLLAVGCGHPGSTAYEAASLFDPQRVEDLFDGLIYTGAADGLPYRLTARATEEPVTQALERTGPVCAAPSVTLTRCGETGPAFATVARWDEGVQIGDWARLSIDGLDLCYRVVALPDSPDITPDPYAVLEWGVGGCGGCTGGTGPYVLLRWCGYDRWSLVDQGAYDAAAGAGLLGPITPTSAVALALGRCIRIDGARDVTGFPAELLLPVSLDLIILRAADPANRLPSCAQCWPSTDPGGPVEPPGDPRIVVMDPLAELLGMSRV